MAVVEAGTLGRSPPGRAVQRMEQKKKRGRPKKADTMDLQNAAPSPSSASPMDEGEPGETGASLQGRRGRPRKSPAVGEGSAATAGGGHKEDRGRGRPKKAPCRGGAVLKNPGDGAQSPSSPLRSSLAVSNNGSECSEPPPKWEQVVRVVPSMDAVVKVFCVHTEPNFSLPWQRKRQYSSSSSGFIIGGRRVLTNAHSVEHYTQVKLKKRGSDTKYLATVLAIGTECDIGEQDRSFFLLLQVSHVLLLLSLPNL